MTVKDILYLKTKFQKDLALLNRVFVNKTTLATVIGCSRTTLNKWLEGAAPKIKKSQLDKVRKSARFIRQGL